MFRNYLVTAWRNLVRNKFYSILNISGLAIGLAVGIMILLWVQDEMSYDRFHAKANRIYKINSHLGTGSGAQVWEGAPAPLTKMAAKVPEIETGVRISDYWANPLYTYSDKKFQEPLKAFVDPAFFEVFDFRMVNGDKKAPFEGSHSVVITESTAKKFFGNESPIGKVLSEDGRETFKVTGVIKDFPQNSTINYAMLFPMSLNAERFRGNGEWKTIDDDLGNYFYKIFFVLKEAADPSAVARKLSNVYETTRSYEPTGSSFSMQALTQLHLYTADGNASAMQRVRIFVLVAIFTLIIACINYVNLSTARSMLRSKEVSMRKIIGAGKKQLFLQFVVESAVLFVFSSLLAIGIIRLLLPLYNELSGKQLSLNMGDMGVWTLLGTAIVGSLAIASIYPAMLLSSFKPIEALKGKISAGMGNAGFRRVLVVTQFVFSIVLITATVVVALQLKYIREKDLGYDKEHVFTFNIRDEMYEHAQAIRSELMKVKGISNVSFMGGDVVGTNGSTGDTDWDGKEANSTFLVNIMGIDEHTIPLFDMKMVAGRNFIGGKSDSAKFILNETAVRDAGIKDPIGKRFKLWDVDGTIVGVLKDFNYASLRERIKPQILFYQPSNSVVAIKTTGQDAAKAIAAAQKLWTSYAANYPFNYSFVDEQYDSMYKSEQRTGVLFNMFAIIAISISCLGLLGLATYTAEVRKREVGIRKVLGASITNITTLLAKNFLTLVLLSIAIAFPIAWWAMSRWLQDFAFRINLSWWIFVVSGTMAVLVAFITVGVQALRAAMANPVRSLKEE